MPAGDPWRRAARRVDDAPTAWVRSGAALLRRELLASLRRDAGDNVLSGQGIPMGVKTSVKGGVLAEAIVSARAPGPWMILEEGTRNRPQGGSSPARRTWSRAVNATLPVIEADLADRFAAAVRL